MNKYHVGIALLLVFYGSVIYLAYRHDAVMDRLELACVNRGGQMIQLPKEVVCAKLELIK